MTNTDQGRAPRPVGEIALVDLLDRVLATGVVISGEVVLSIADVDLVYISLRALVSSVRAGGPGPLTLPEVEDAAGRGLQRFA
jgi:hypothetical protein